MQSFDNVRSAVLKAGNDLRVEVNQRALIDKILARYASENAVYRELLQNSNDALAKNAELRFSTRPPPNDTQKSVVTQVVYRNDGHPFREQDWSRLRNIAEGNPDVSKVGAFGVGAYTMFSISEEPLVVSGHNALAFSWRGDALWTRTAPVSVPDKTWTSFVLPSRDVYPLPDLIPLAQFLCISLTFTNSLRVIRVFVDDKEVIVITKKIVEPPTAVSPPRASSWFAGDGMVTSSPSGLFYLNQAPDAVRQHVVEISVKLQGDEHTVRARYISASVNVGVSAEMQRRIERVTKKNPPQQLLVQVFIDASARSNPTNNRAARVTEAFSPSLGAGRVFIGFRTSQTTGIAANLSAPFVPTVEREAIDFQDSALRDFNAELLFMSGMLMRLTLEHSMDLVGLRWNQNKEKRAALEQEFEKENTIPKVVESPSQSSIGKDKKSERSSRNDLGKREDGGGAFKFIRFMASGVKRIANAIAVQTGLEDKYDVLNPSDPFPLSDEERDAIMLMKAFSPQPSTPDALVGEMIANGFISCMPKLSPPVITKSGIVRAADSALPFQGIEAFVKQNVVRKVVVENAETYVKHVANCYLLSIDHLITELTNRSLKNETELIQLIKWWVRFSNVNPVVPSKREKLRNCLKFVPNEAELVIIAKETGKRTLKLADIRHFREGTLLSSTLPMPASVMPIKMQDEITINVLKDEALRNWVESLSFIRWAQFVVGHACLNDGSEKDSEVRLEVLALLSRQLSSKQGVEREQFGKWLFDNLSKRKCIPFYSPIAVSTVTDFPTDLYLPDAEIGIFEGLGSFRKVSPSLEGAGVMKEFLLTVGVRKSIAINFLFCHLDKLKWNEDPRPLIRYLRKAELSSDDLETLQSSAYLPEARDKSRTYMPAELYLPDPELSVFLKLKVLQWPSMFDRQSEDAVFLKKLGCQTTPPLGEALNYIANEVTDKGQQEKCLMYVAKSLGPNGVYYRSYGPFKDIRFLPAVRKDPFEDNEPVFEKHSPKTCFADSSAACMGFPIFGPNIERGTGRMLADRFQCRDHPLDEQLVNQLKQLVSTAKRSLDRQVSEQHVTRIVITFWKIFKYLSTSSSSKLQSKMTLLQRLAFIPYQSHAKIEWCKPTDVFFESSNDEISGQLFKVVPFDPFLATIGVRMEPSSKDLVAAVLSSPEEVLRKVGGVKNYLKILRRLAASLGLPNITAEVRRSPFLIAYRINKHEKDDGGSGIEPEEAGEIACLAKAEDISVVDNSTYARMFSVLRAPQESDLEEFYTLLGSKYISKRVQRDYNTSGLMKTDTLRIKQFSERFRERRPLLVSPSLYSQPLHSLAASRLADENVSFFEVSTVSVSYRLGSEVKYRNVTCCAKLQGKVKCHIYITDQVDWFDVGYAIGDLILTRSGLQESLFLDSLLKTPLHQLRVRGFPVDRILNSSSTEPRLDLELNKPDKLRPELKDSNRSPTLKPSASSQKEGFVEILKDMYPTCSSNHIRDLLGPNPSLDKLREVADSLSDGSYPIEDKRSSNGESSSWNSSDSSENGGKPSSRGRESKPPRESGKNIFRRALSGFANFNNDGKAGQTATAYQGNARGAPFSKDDNRVISTQEDADTQNRLNGMLMNAASNSRAVSSNGISSPGGRLLSSGSPSLPRGLLNSIPECDFSHSHYLKPHGTAKTSNGVRVFVTENNESSEQFVMNNREAVERFAIVLLNLAGLCDVAPNCIAIYHEPTGRVIAFNANRALYFNLRYFIALHYRQNNSVNTECYVYWLTIMSHELAHNLVGQHTRDHAQYTEIFMTMYMPKLIAALPNLLQRHSNQ